MIEITATEFGLLIWAILATAFYLDTKRENRMAKHFIRHMLDDDSERERIVGEYKAAQTATENNTRYM
jgi:transposase-like protein